MQYTPSQNKAINARGESILLSAGAGSGKTKVLVERIIKMITEEHISVEQLLVVTFTKAAAGEMKNRIFEALNQKLLQTSTKFLIAFTKLSQRGGSFGM